MTVFWPGHGEGKNDEEIRQIFLPKQWLVLEMDYLDDIVRRCWKDEFQDIDDLRSELNGFIVNVGWEVDGDDLRGFDGSSLFKLSTL